MAYFAALAAGFGGLLVELAAVRRVGLSIGNTAEAAAWVVGVFLLGLGVGGLIVALGSGLRRRPARWAGIAYATVALATCAGDASVQAMGAVDGAFGFAIALVHPGVAALAMGVAFPLLFAGAARAGALIAINLLGSVVACAIGGNVLVPELGIRGSHWVGAACYAVAAIAAFGVRRVEAVEGDTRGGSVPGWTYRVVAVAGFGTVGLEILLLRRLPFFLEGFQPTMSGVLAVCLAGLAAGSAWGAPLLRRMCGTPTRALAVALGGGAVASCLGLHEMFAPPLSKLAVDSGFGMHARIWAAAAVSGVPACLFFGAVPPLCLDAVGAIGSARAGVAGRLFCAQGVGALGGSLVLGHLLPEVATTGYFVFAPLAVGCAAVAVAPTSAGRRVAVAAWIGLCSMVGIAGPGQPWSPSPPVEGSRFDRDRYRHLAHATDSFVTASVVYDRDEHRMILFTDEFRAAYTGPDTAYMKVLGHLPFLLRPELRDVAVIALGTGTTADAVTAWPEPETIHVVEISSAVLSLVDWFDADGPIPTGRPATFRADPRTEVHLTDGRHWLGAQPEDSLDLVTMEPLLPYAPGTAPLYSAEFYAAARRALRPDGLLVQWVPTHSMPADFFATLLKTFGAGFAHTSAWLVDQSTLLVGSERPHLPELDVLRARLASAPPRAATTLHEAGLVGISDLDVAFVGSDLATAFGDAGVLVDDRPTLERIGYWSGAQRLAFYPDNLQQLLPLALTSQWGGPDAAAVRSGRIEGLIARASVALGGDPTLAVRAVARPRSERPDSVLLHREETLAWRAVREREVLALGPGPDAERIARRQLARDEGSARLLRAATDVAIEGALEDLSTLPDDPGLLVASATGEGGRAVALRAAYPVRIARAVIRLAGAAVLPDDAASLRSVFDPVSLEQLVGAVARRGGDSVAECAPFWRSDLPMPRSFADRLEGSTPERIALAEALAGHRGPRTLAVLAELLVDGDSAVRSSAGAALFRSVGQRVPYDPLWEESRLRDAANAVRRLHNRAR